ncbi:MAG TPA: tail fiber domain-containing protein [Ferruginibacter sp.]|nr:tail fiber domain-containing protein [Ferruginibacter sp.]
MRAFIIFCINMTAYACLAQNVGIGIPVPATKLHVVDPTPLTIVITGENTYVGGTDGIGVYGRSVNNPGFGNGVSGEGGQAGVFGYGYGTSFTGTTYGVYGQSLGSLLVGTRTGVYGSAAGGAINYGVYCDGNGVYTGTWTLASDLKFKKDLSPVGDALELIRKLNPVSYLLKKAEFPMMNFPTGRQFGFIAQEVENVIPQLVENSTHPGAKKEDKDIEFKAVNYIGMIPILAKAIQELNEKVELLQKENEALKQRLPK